MDFELSEKAIDFRSQVKSFIENNLTSEIISKMHKTGTFNDKSFNEALASEGLLAGAVPGYGDRDPVELYLLFNELEKAGAPYDGLAVTMLVAGIINAVGTEFHHEEILKKLLLGNIIVA